MSKTTERVIEEMNKQNELEAKAKRILRIWIVDKKVSKENAVKVAEKETRLNRVWLDAQADKIGRM